MNSSKHKNIFFSLTLNIVASSQAFISKSLVTCMLSFSLFSYAFCQSKTDLEKYRYPEDSLKKAKKIMGRKFIKNIRPTEKFDLLWNNGFLLLNKESKSYEVRSASSGTTFLGLSLNYIAGPKFLFKAQPGVCWYGYSIGIKGDQYKPLYSFEGQKTTDKKISATYIEMPIAIAFVLKSDTAKGKFISMIETGVSFGYAISNRFSCTEMINGREAGVSFSNIPDLNKIKIGLHGKVTYGIVGLWFYYRLNSFFQSDKLTFSGLPYPNFSKLELGFSIIL